MDGWPCGVVSMTAESIVPALVHRVRDAEVLPAPPLELSGLPLPRLATLPSELARWRRSGASSPVVALFDLGGRVGFQWRLFGSSGTARLRDSSAMTAESLAFEPPNRCRPFSTSCRWTRSALSPLPRRTPVLHRWFIRQEGLDTATHGLLD